MTTHDPILDRRKPGCVIGVLEGLGVLAGAMVLCVLLIVGAAALAVQLWRVLT